ncbi:MAG: tripartite tricarboxylate transporter substrate binding protein [Herminiimonas sp.]|nr:tripartite tricarboxylate transporter substrate binding protein [Herminiimonas sp.]
MNNTRRRMLAALLGASLCAVTAGASAQAFPSKPVTIIVPFAPGGGADTLIRLLAPRLSAQWGKPVIVDNRPGASGQIGANYVAQAPADGHTLLMATTAAITDKNVNRFAPVALVSAEAYVVTVNNALPVQNIRELIAYAKANPGKLHFGSSGIGAASHLSAELFKSKAKIDMQHVPYKGTGQALTDLLAGHIEVMFAPVQTVMPHLQANRLKAIAVTGAKPSPTLPKLPTVASSGLPDYQAVGWFGLLAPAATPKATLAKLHEDVSRLLASPEVRKDMMDRGAEPTSASAEEFGRFIRQEQAKWSKTIKDAGIDME